VLSVEGVSLGLMVGEQGLDIDAHALSLPDAGLGTDHALHYSEIILENVIS
jgi:hypothetical protein